MTVRRLSRWIGLIRRSLGPSGGTDQPDSQTTVNVNTVKP